MQINNVVNASKIRKGSEVSYKLLLDYLNQIEIYMCILPYLLLLYILNLIVFMYTITNRRKEANETKETRKTKC